MHFVFDIGMKYHRKIIKELFILEFKLLIKK